MIDFIFFLNCLSKEHRCLMIIFWILCQSVFCLNKRQKFPKIPNLNSHNSLSILLRKFKFNFYSFQVLNNLPILIDSFQNPPTAVQIVNKKKCSVPTKSEQPHLNVPTEFVPNCTECARVPHSRGIDTDT